jgi:hypothetical protein
MTPHSECEFDEFSRRNKRWWEYSDAADGDYVPAGLRPSSDYNNNNKVRSKPFQPDVTLEEAIATAISRPDILVPNWLAWVVIIGMIVAVLAIAGWAVRPESIFLQVATIGVAVVTAGLFYGEHYLNEHNN